MAQLVYIDLFTYTLSGFTTPACGTQSFELASTGDVKTEIIYEDTVYKALLIDTTQTVDGSLLKVPIKVTLDDWPEITKDYVQ